MSRSTVMSKKNPLPTAGNLHVRWPSKPKKGRTCDAVERSQDETGLWHLDRCGVPAIETCVTGEKNYLTTLCQAHAIDLEQRGQVRRNPKFKKKRKKRT